MARAQGTYLYLNKSEMHLLGKYTFIFIFLLMFFFLNIGQKNVYV